MSDLIASEVERTGLSPFVVRALLKAGLTPPHRDVVDRVGYGAAEVRALLPALHTAEAT
jgi:hypothetical protein